MSCKHCTDPNGEACFPQYGVGPHTHEERNGIPFFGSTKTLPREDWPDNYREDPNTPGLGVWWCPYCGEGKPEDTKGGACDAALGEGEEK